jgi:hypothetical protein
MMADDLKPCPDCGVAPGQLHERGCDVERCPYCGMQRLGCECMQLSAAALIEWTGEWPGNAEARAFGFFCLLDAALGWVRCAADTPGAMPDLNRLHAECRWDRPSKRWVKR